jgi:RNA polymerase primary sigma factor
MPSNTSKPSPSILDDVPMPFSQPPKIHGVGDDFLPAYQTWQTQRTPQNNTALLKTLQPVLDTAVTSYAGGNQSPTIKSRAKLMALKAMESFDPNRGNVRTHLLSQLQSLRRLSAQEQNIIHLPEQVGLDFQNLNESENELRDSMGRDPTDEELSNHTNLSVRRIRKIRKFHQPISEGTVVGQESDENDPTDIASQVPGGGHRAADAWMNFVYDDLGATDKLIMDMTLGRNGKRRTPTQEIARKLGITPGAVSQRAAKIQTMLDKRYTQGGF